MTYIVETGGRGGGEAFFVSAQSDKNHRSATVSSLSFFLIYFYSAIREKLRSYEKKHRVFGTVSE